MRTYAAATGFLKTIRRCPDEVSRSHGLVLLMPYHKEQHYNDKMVCRRDNRNLEVLERAPCITGILADRPFQRGHLIRALAGFGAGATVGARRGFEGVVRVHMAGKAVVGATACGGAR